VPALLDQLSELTLKASERDWSAQLRLLALLLRTERSLAKKPFDFPIFTLSVDVR